jgi:hypothetical protein
MTELIPPNTAIRRKRCIRPGAAAASWLRNCHCDERGFVLPNLANLLVALRAAPELSDVFAFD